jgi:hypothetical protein
MLWPSISAGAGATACGRGWTKGAFGAWAQSPAGKHNAAPSRRILKLDRMGKS